jgi:serine/threonine-protein kinase
MPAVTKDQALAALAALAQFGGLPAFTPTIPGASYTGHVSLLADHLDDAIPALRRGASSCTVLGETIANTRAWMDLGTALEARGDKEGACEAYRTVLGRWGHAKPRSVTADEARTHASALGCQAPSPRP